MNDVLLLSMCLILPVAGMIALLLLPTALQPKANLLLVLAVAIVTSVPAVRALTGHTIDVLLSKTIVFGNIAFRIDRLSAWFILIINLTCINGAFYGMGYMKAYEGQRTELSMHWMLFLLFQSSMLWVCMVHNGLAFLVVWELMSLSSFLLVIFDHRKKATLQAGINYLVQMHIGVLFLTTAFMWVYYAEGSFEFTAIAHYFSTHMNLSLFLLFFAGFGIKAGFIPLHTWLPQAHPAAPSHISGIMSGVIVKLGIYGILRMIFLLQKDQFLTGEIVIIVSIATCLFGILNAAVHRDIKKMLAYCTIENIGIIGLGMGMGLLGLGAGNPYLVLSGFSAALLHTLNHSLFKSLLFFNAGTVYQQTHTRDMEKLGGLIHRMPITALLFLIGAMAIGGLPPFNGFVSEFILYKSILSGIGAIDGAHIIVLLMALAALALTGGLSMLAFTKSFGTIFLGSPRTPMHQPPQEPGWLMRLPQYIIVLIIVSIGVYPQVYVTFVDGIVNEQLPAAGAHITSFPWAIGKAALLFMALTLAIWLIRRSINARRPLSTGATWGCGYIAPTAKIQYTGKSFSKSLGKLLNVIVLEKKKYREIQAQEIFPAGRKYASHYNDFFLTRVFGNIVDRLLYSLNYFQFIQNGKIQMYILYGVFFIVLVFFGTLFKLL